VRAFFHRRAALVWVTLTFFRSEPNPRIRAGQLIWFFSWLIVTAFAIYLHPDPNGHGTHQELGLPPCPSVLLWDRPCPGCGLTTSWTAFVHGDFAMAFHAHPLGPPLYLFFTAGALLSLYGWRKKVLLLTDTSTFTRWFAFGFAIFIGFGAYRMATTSHFRTAQEKLFVNAEGAGELPLAKPARRSTQESGSPK